MGGLDVWRHLIGMSARWAGLCSVLLRCLWKVFDRHRLLDLVIKKAVAVTAFNILTFLRSVKRCSMNLGLEEYIA